MDYMAPKNEKQINQTQTLLVQNQRRENVVSQMYESSNKYKKHGRMIQPERY